MKNTISNIFVLNILVILVLLWVGMERINTFRDYHVAIAQESTDSVSNAIERFIAESKRTVKLFSRDNIQLINQFINSPDDEQLYEKLKKRVSEYFPGYFAVNVVDKNGELVRADFEGYVGDLCLSDLESFRSSSKQMPRVHPNEEAYHIDVLARLNGATDGNILLISFRADKMGDLLSSSEVAGHHIMLVYEELSHLIEVTSSGSRINWERNDYRLTDDELARILHKAPVKNTVWTAIDLYQPGLFNHFRNTVLKQSLFVLIVFVLISLIMYRKIIKEEKLRKQAEAYKDDFLSVVSHELRTPITAIKGSLGLLVNEVAGEVNKDVKQLMNVAFRNSERLAYLINDLLDVQKMEAGKMVYNIQVNDLVAIVKESIANNLGYAKQFNVKFKYDGLKTPFMLGIDAVRISQVMANLLSNAVKYGAENDEVVISLAVENNMARVSVQDHGPGIPESFQTKVFLKFAQKDTSSAREVTGTGLGLHISKQIIESHKGRLDFTSKVGKGTCFYFELPTE